MRRNWLWVLGLSLILGAAIVVLLQAWSKQRAREQSLDHVGPGTTQGQTAEHASKVRFDWSDLEFSPESGNGRYSVTQSDTATAVDRDGVVHLDQLLPVQRKRFTGKGYFYTERLAWEMYALDGIKAYDRALKDRGLTPEMWDRLSEAQQEALIREYRK